jgi:hypothetical protein
MSAPLTLLSRLRSVALPQRLLAGLRLYALAPGSAAPPSEKDKKACCAGWLLRAATTCCPPAHAVC